ncbi:MAG: hypothetical protein M1833_001387 [Piccolia ochrophora]|nr:MAG: hypothetical protein M1833_001387 [Piccolia ochrophora]
MTGASSTIQSEDCLTLNIWSKPTNSSGKADKPVLVFFYGGRFTIGNTHTPFYNGTYFADAEDIIVVTVNYRLNIFGFPGTPGEVQNLGLRDQRVAVEWIRENIASFGGNPRKITISGQSSGGVAVDYWSYAYKEDPIAHGLIAHSGNAFSFPVNAPEVPARNWYNVSGQLGCGTSGDVLACMRQQDWQDIKAAAAKVRPIPSSSVLRSIPPFYPTVDEETVFSDYLALAEAGNFTKLAQHQPMLLGNNQDEQGYYKIPAYANGIDPTPGTRRVLPARILHMPQLNVPVWQYRYFGDWDNTRLYPSSGAYHATDLHMIFGGSGDASGIPPSPAQEQTTSLMQRAWAAFCKDPANGLSGVMKWPRFDPDEERRVSCVWLLTMIPCRIL